MNCLFIYEKANVGITRSMIRRILGGIFPKSFGDNLLDCIECGSGCRELGNVLLNVN